MENSKFSSGDSQKIALEGLRDLTKREEEILEILLRGYSCKETAILLGISYRTVQAHRARILLKTGARNFIALAHLISSQLPHRPER